MGPLQELLATDQRRAIEFFFVGLKDVSGPGVDTEELLYNASLLAHYAQVSTLGDSELAAPTTLSGVFDRYVFDAKAAQDSFVMETAGAQCLLLAGFFEAQMRRRHNIRWYAELGSAFFHRAALLDSSSPKALVLAGIGWRFEAWRQRYARLSRDLRDQPLLVTPPKRFAAGGH